jgi:hypothetical protein
MKEKPPKPKKQKKNYGVRIVLDYSDSWVIVHGVGVAYSPKQAMNFAINAGKVKAKCEAPNGIERVYCFFTSWMRDRNEFYIEVIKK